MQISPVATNTILIIDSDRKFAESTKRFLLSHGYHVTLAFNGNQALKKISSDHFFLTLLCFELSDMEGGDLLKRIHEIDPNQLIIVTGALDKKNGIGDWIYYGVVDFFPKPIKNTELLGILKKVPLSLNPLVNDPGPGGSLYHKFFPFLIHELRNPLQAIGGAVSIIERRSNLKDKALAQSLRIIKEEVQYLGGFVQKCLDFIRPTDKNFWIKIDLSELVSHCIEMIGYMLPEIIKDIRINTHFDPHSPKVYGNYEEIKEVILNLLKNSIEAMDHCSSKELTIKIINKTLHGSGWVDVVISDKGSGINKENLRNLGFPFFTTKLRGTGLGLAICYKIIVDRHKGKILVESEEGKGTTITIKLPVSPITKEG